MLVPSSCLSLALFHVPIPWHSCPIRLGEVPNFFVAWVGVGDAQVIGQILDPGPQGCVPCRDRKALRRDRQILLSQVQIAPVLGICRQIGRQRCFVAMLFWQWEYGVAPVP